MIEEKSCLEKIEEGLKKFWREHGRASTVKGLHTEISIEPRFFINGMVNSEIAELLVEVSLSKATQEDIEKGRVSIGEGGLILNDEAGRLIAKVKNPRIISQFAERFGL